MRRVILLFSLFLALMAAKPAEAANQQILVQSNLGTPSIKLVCLLTGCQVSQSLAGSPSNFYLLSFPASSNASFLQTLLQGIPGILNALPVSGSQNPIGNRYIVHTTGGLLNLPLLCDLGLCSTIQSIDGAGNQVFLLAGSSNQNPNVILSILLALPGVVNAELDQVVSIATGSATATTPPPSLVDTTPVQFYGSTVWTGYVNQPATQLIRTLDARNDFNVTGIRGDRRH